MNLNIRALITLSFLAAALFAGCRSEAPREKGGKSGAAKEGAETFDLGGGVKLEMVYLNGGTFQMGSPNSDSERFDNEGPIHEIVLDGFWMGKYEVTQEQYQQIMGTNPSDFQGSKNPVETVSWDDAMNFCAKLGKKAGKKFTLPTEAQWEYACRAGSNTRFCFGDSESGLGNYAWYGSNSEFTARSVGQKQQNAFGLYDMHGNIWEWCQDWYAKDYYGSSPRKNPEGPSSGRSRVLRGGSWRGNAYFCRSASRLRYDPLSTGNILGFRVCCLFSAR